MTHLRVGGVAGDLLVREAAAEVVPPRGRAAGVGRGDGDAGGEGGEGELHGG